MSDLATAEPRLSETPPAPVREAGLGSIGVLVLTSIHHSYGAYVYQTPWRHHVTVIAIPVIVILVGALTIVRSSTHSMRRGIATWIFTLVVIVIPIAWIGLFEGGYNHVLKNLLYFGGVSAERLRALFPPPTYEMPSSVFFEVTGIAQFPMALVAAYWTYRLCMHGTRSGGR